MTGEQLDKAHGVADGFVVLSWPEEILVPYSAPDIHTNMYARIEYAHRMHA